LQAPGGAVDIHQYHSKATALTEYWTLLWFDGIDHLVMHIPGNKKK
jgi:hypothetical protein